MPQASSLVRLNPTVALDPPCPSLPGIDLSQVRSGISIQQALDLRAAVHGLTIHIGAEDLCRRLNLPIPWLRPHRHRNH